MIIRGFVIRVFVLLGAILTLTMAHSAQHVPTVLASESGKITGALNLEYQSDNFMCLAVGPVDGTIARSGKDGPRGEEYWIEVRSDKPLKVIKGRIIHSVNASTHNVFGISIPAAFRPIGDVIGASLLKKGHRVRLRGWNCGSGGFLSVRSILIDPKPKDFLPDTPETLTTLSGNEALNKLRILRAEISSSIATAQKEFNQEIAPGMRTGPKEEFETSWEADARLRKLESLRAAKQEIYGTKIVKYVTPKIAEYAQLLHAVYPKPIKAAIGLYDADLQEFPISSGGVHLADVKVPRSIAKDLKEFFSEAQTFMDYAFVDDDDEKELHFSPIRFRVVYKGQQFIGDTL